MPILSLIVGSDLERCHDEATRLKIPHENIITTPEGLLTPSKLKGHRAPQLMIYWCGGPSLLYDAVKRLVARGAGFKAL